MIGRVGCGTTEALQGPGGLGQTRTTTGNGASLDVGDTLVDVATRIFGEEELDVWVHCITGGNAVAE